MKHSSLRKFAAGDTAHPYSNLDSTHLELEKLGARGHGGSILYEQFLDNPVDRGRHLRMAKTSQ
jgi:hypothetical protein